MKIIFIALIVVFVSIRTLSAQIDSEVTSSADLIQTKPDADVSLSYNLSSEGKSLPINWGLDLAWLSRDNVRRGMAFMGKERVDIIRSSFTPTAALINGKLQTNEMNRLNERLDIISLLKPDVKVVLNCDHPSVDPYFKGNPKHWAELIDVTTRLHQEKGYTVVTVSPFNEPDYSATGQGDIADFYAIAGELKKNNRFNDIRISGGNTLNCDEALPWYNYLKDRLDEGNTHQLAGNFDGYASFFETVRANGHHATNDELHNVMEAMVGAEYGLQTGIWWGTAEYARGEFVKASDGERLAYAEHRKNWTAASVYRAPDGKVQAFGGTSERQAATTSYRYISLDRDVFYNGQGPQRDFIVTLPGGSGYQNGQTNAENVVNITWGDDIQPVINGRYILVNRKSGKVMELENGSSTAGTNLQQYAYSEKNYQHWDITPVSTRVGGDFSYYTIKSAYSAKAADIYNWSLDNGGNIVVWDDTKGGNQQWYLEYAEEGWFYIRSRHSAKCLTVSNSSTSNGANIVQWDFNKGHDQQWRFLPVGAPVEFEAPSSPSGITATGNAASIRIDWTESPETDVEGYTILRSTNESGPYATIAQKVSTSSFVDLTVKSGVSYYYKVLAQDRSLNRSEYSAIVTASTNGAKELVTCLKFEGNTKDISNNYSHAALYGNITYSEDNFSGQALELDGNTAFLQLAPNAVNFEEITVAAWVKWNTGASWQRIFDFGADEEHYMYLTPRMRFTIKNGEEEQQLNADKMPQQEWVHVGITMGESGIRMFLDGEIVAATNELNLSPADINPIFNYIGKGQYPIPLFNGSIDEFRIYNYELSPDEFAQLLDPTTSKKNIASTNWTIWPVPVNDKIHIKLPIQELKNAKIELYNSNGQKLLSQPLTLNESVLSVSQIPDGIYAIKLLSHKQVSVKKIVIKH